MRKFFLSISAITVVLISFFVLKIKQLDSYYKAKGRINFLVYSPQFYVYSYDLVNTVDYLIKLETNLKFDIAGGFGLYEIGSVGKIAYLEKNNDILLNAFSSLLGLPIDFYFYKNTNQIYRDFSQDKVAVLRLWDVWSLNSNLNFIEKIYFLTKLVDINKRNLKVLSLNRFVNKEGVIDNDLLSNDLQGVFYSNLYSKEDKLIVIYSWNYLSGQRLSKVLEGIGLNVFTVSKSVENLSNCLVVENGVGERSRTAEFLIKYFNCEYQIDPDNKDDFVDIEFYLNNLVEQWK
ncbi:MAG: hypothetical protein KatS3mg090_0722 [Patescibacteria group bacterium]|nr:MAG: hypothetical protein KatS3mg090_0722 [Patescibacteria group bacterium]